MALVLKSGSSRSSSLGALFVSNPKRKRNPVRKRKNVAKKRNPVRKRKTTAKRRKSTRRKVSRPSKRLVLKLNPLRMKRRKNVRRRKNSLAIKRRKNSLAIKRRKNGTKKGMVRRTARKAYVKNGRRKKRVARRIMRNPNMDIKALQPVKKLVGKVPVLKSIAPYLGASVLGMAVVVPYSWAYGRVSQYIQTSELPQAVKTVDKYAGIALTGMGVAVLANYLLGMSKMVSKKTAKNSAIAIAILSGGAQFMRLKEMYDAGQLQIPFLQKKSDESVTITTDTKPNGAQQGLAYLSGGMAYDVVPMSGVHMNGTHMGMYHDASALDATQAPHDLDAKEKAMALRGAMAWQRAFGQCPHRASSLDGCSRYAGKHGHRWGWLIKVLGWDRFAKLCKMSAPNRIRAISQIKIACINSAQKTFDSSSYSGLAVDMGSLAYSQDSYSGLAMVGSVH